MNNIRSRHGKSYTTEYRSWQLMKERCHNPNSIDYKNYGGRGIKVCARWRNSFSNFLHDMGDKPSQKHTIDRIRVNGGYSPSNCKWSTMKEQQNNRRDNRKVIINGETKNLCQWAEFFGITNRAVNVRINRGWDVVKAITTPLLLNGKKLPKPHRLI